MLLWLCTPGSGVLRGRELFVKGAEDVGAVGALVQESFVGSIRLGFDVFDFATTAFRAPFGKEGAEC